MEVEFYRGEENSRYYYHRDSRIATEKYSDHGGTGRSKGSDGFYYGAKQNETLMNGSANGKQGKMADRDSDSVASFDSTGKRKSFRRLITRFAERTSMQGVPYINNAKYWWAKLIWSLMLLVALGVMSLHLWYLIDQYTSWPKQTKISLGFETLKFPEVTICNTNVMHKGRLDRYVGAYELKDLVEDLQPENLVPGQFDPDYDPYETKPQGQIDAPNNQPKGQTDAPNNQLQGQTDAPNNQPQGQTDAPNNQPQGQTDAPNNQPQGQTDAPNNQPQGQTDAPNNQPQGQTDATINQPQGQTEAPNNQPQGQTDAPINQPQGQTDAPNNQPQGQTDATNTQPQGQTDATNNQGADQTQNTTPKSGQDSGILAPPDQGSSKTNGSPPPPKRRKRFVDEYENFNKTLYKPDDDDRPSPRDIEGEEEDDYDGKIDAQTEIDDLFTEMYMDIDKTNRAKLGHNITDMLISCTFNGRKCSAEMFHLHQTSEYGNCWSIRSDKFNVKKSGPPGGLTLTMFLEVGEYLKGVTTGYGARVQIHEQRTHPFPAEEGLFIPAAMETDIGLRMIAIERLGGKYGKCDDGQAFKRAYSLKHTRRTCQKFCMISKMIKNCKCFNDEAEEFADATNGGLRPCRSQKEVKCMVNVQKEFGSQTFTCDCDNPCNEIQYMKAVSQRQWPTEEYAMVLLQGICERDKKVCATLRDDIDDAPKIRGNKLINNNFVKLNIYYEDLNYENITEVPEIEIQQFLSDVGGAIGLWIGLSILSLCEVIQLFVELCGYGVHKTVNERKSDRNKRRKERRRHGTQNESFAEKDENKGQNLEFRHDNKDIRNGYFSAPPRNGFSRQDFSHHGSNVINERPSREDYNSYHYFRH